MIISLHKYFKWDYLLVLLLIIVSSRNSLLFTAKPSLIIFTFISGWLFLKRGHRFSSSWLYISIGYVVLHLIYFIQFRHINVEGSGKLYLLFLYAYFTIHLVKDSFFVYLEDIVYKLALISLPLFLLQLSFFEQVYTAVNWFEGSFPIFDTRPEMDYTTTFFFTINHPNRNSGFMWEPGAFAAMLAITMFVHLIIRKGKPNYKFWIMGIALLTTFSTTGYILIVVLGSYFVYNKRLKFFYIPLLIGLVLFIAGIDFVLPKITSQFDTRFELVTNEKKYKNFDQRSLGRFGSLMVDLKDWSESPIWGVGYHHEVRTQGSYIEFGKTNGLSDYLVRFGIIGIILMFLCLNNTFKTLMKKYGQKGSIFGPLIVFILGFSNPMLLSPFFLILQLYFLVSSSKTPESNHGIEYA